MKQFLLGLGIVGLLMASCARSPKKAVTEPAVVRTVTEAVPDFVSDALKKAPPDALVGIGVAKSGNMMIAMDVARARARAEIARQINQVVTVMVRNYSDISETDPAMVQTFQERITIITSKATLPATPFIAQGTDADGAYWIVAMLEKPQVSDVITQAQNEAANDFPQMSSFDTSSLLPDALAAIIQEEIAVAR